MLLQRKTAVVDGVGGVDRAVVRAFAREGARLFPCGPHSGKPMSTQQTAVAESFSRHEFSSTYSHLAPDVQWHNIGGVDHGGRDAVISACNDASAYFDRSKAAVTIRRTVSAGNVVVVEAVGDVRRR